MRPVDPLASRMTFCIDLRIYGEATWDQSMCICFACGKLVAWESKCGSVFFTYFHCHVRALLPINRKRSPHPQTLEPPSPIKAGPDPWSSYFYQESSYWHYLQLWPCSGAGICIIWITGMYVIGVGFNLS